LDLTHKEKIMDNGNWLVGWRAIGKYIGKSGKTAQRWVRLGMPFFRDTGGRPIAIPWQVDKWIIAVNQRRYDNKIWTDKGIGMALAYERDKEKVERSSVSGLLRRRGLHGAVFNLSLYMEKLNICESV
jgi:transposase